MAMMAEREEGNSRSIRLPLSETTTVFDMELPVQATRANKVLEHFTSTTFMPFTKKDHATILKTLTHQTFANFPNF